MALEQGRCVSARSSLGSLAMLLGQVLQCSARRRSPLLYCCMLLTLVVLSFGRY